MTVDANVRIPPVAVVLLSVGVDLKQLMPDHLSVCFWPKADSQLSARFEQ